MKPILLIRLLSFTAILLLVACAGLDRVVYDGTKRAPTSTVDVYQDRKLPVKRYKEVAAFMAYGMRDMEVSAQKKMIEAAQKIGANGLIFQVNSAGIQAGPLGAAPKFTFKGTAIVYE